MDKEEAIAENLRVAIGDKLDRWYQNVLSSKAREEVSQEDLNTLRNAFADMVIEGFASREDELCERITSVMLEGLIDIIKEA